MLAPKRMQREKKIIYGVILAVLAVATGIVLYWNFFAGGDTAVIAPADTPGAGPTVSSGGYRTDELDFLQDERFKQLRRLGEPITVPQSRTSNPFSPNER